MPPYNLILILPPYGGVLLSKQINRRTRFAHKTPVVSTSRQEIRAKEGPVKKKKNQNGLGGLRPRASDIYIYMHSSPPPIPPPRLRLYVYWLCAGLMMVKIRNELPMNRLRKKIWITYDPYYNQKAESAMSPESHSAMGLPIGLPIHSDRLLNGWVFATDY